MVTDVLGQNDRGVDVDALLGPAAHEHAGLRLAVDKGDSPEPGLGLFVDPGLVGDGRADLDWEILAEDLDHRVEPAGGLVPDPERKVVVLLVLGGPEQDPVIKMAAREVAEIFDDELAVKARAHGDILRIDQGARLEPEIAEVGGGLVGPRVPRVGIGSVLLGDAAEGRVEVQVGLAPLPAGYPGDLAGGGQEQQVVRV